MLSFLLCTLAITATASPLTRPDIFIDADDLFAALPLSGYGLAAPQPLIQAAHHEYTFCAEWGGRCPRPNSRFGYIRTYENFKKCDSGVEGFGGIFSSCRAVCCKRANKYNSDSIFVGHKMYHGSQQPQAHHHQ